MRVAFYGTARRIGTSANMAAVSAGILQYGSPAGAVFTDCSKQAYTKELFLSFDLLVLNLPIPCQESLCIYYNHSFVHKNVIFLIGKYYKNQSDELKKFIRQYRLDPLRICMMPYNPGFGNAYECRKLSGYFAYDKNAAKSYEDQIFEKHLKHTVNTIITYGNRKGENHYG